MNTPNIKELARRYPRFIRWSEEDKCYVGSLPDLDGDCTHGDTPEEVAANLDECAEIYVADTLEEGGQLPEPHCFIVTPSRYRLPQSGNRIADLRRSFGLSQSEFAKALGITLSALSKWEIDDRRPSGAAAKLLRVLEKNPDAIKA